MFRDNVLIIKQSHMQISSLLSERSTLEVYVGREYSMDENKYKWRISIDPCGTPVVIPRLSDAVLSLSSYCCLFVK